MSFLSLNEIRSSNLMERQLTEKKNWGGELGKKEKTLTRNGGVEDAD